RVGKKGYIILPKALRETFGINEGDEVLVEVGDGITLKPLRKGDIRKLKAALDEQARRLTTIEGAREPKPGELAGVSLEEEFEG
ncbi:MAG: AbrB/MazE/SpoVT family DNA-binding domain-containing protein, partial [Candidatus Methanosuratincola petrocarbonis]